MKALLRVALGVLFVGLLLACVPGPAAPVPLPARPKVQEITLPFAPLDVAVHAETGAVATLSADGQELHIFPELISKGKVNKPLTVKVGPKATEVAFKRLGQKNLYLVTTSDPGQVVVIDADKAQVVKKIALDTNVVRNLRTSRNPADVYAYYFGPSEGRVGRVNLEKLTNEGLSSGSGQFEVAADGALLYITAYRGGPFHAYTIAPAPVGDRAPFTLRAVNPEGLQENMLALLPDPLGQFVVIDGKLRTPDLKTILARTAQQPALVCASRPLLVAVKGKELVFTSSNTGDQVGTTELPGAIVPKEDPNLRDGDKDRPRFFDKDGFGKDGPGPGFGRPGMGSTWSYRVLEHAETQTLLVCRADRVVLYSLPDLGLPEEPFLTYKLEGSPRLIAGRAAELALRVGTDKITVEMSSGPKGAKLEKNQFVWTPTDTDIGAHRLQVRLAAGKVSVTRDLTLSVRRPVVEMPMSVTQLAVAADANAALALGPDDKATRLALVDLAGLKVTAERTFPNPVSVPAFDEHHVYLAAANTDAFQVLDRKTLADVKRIFTAGRVRAFVPVAGKWLFIATENGRLQVLKVPELTLAEPGEVGLGTHLSAQGESRSKTQPVPVGTQWWYDNMLFDAQLSKTSQVARPTGFVSSGSQGDPYTPYDRPRYPGDTGALPVPASVAPYGVAIGGDGFLVGKRSVRLQAAPGESTYEMVRVPLTEQPAVVGISMISTTPVSDPRARNQKVMLKFYDLMGGAANHEVTLRDEAPAPADFRNPYNPETPRRQLVERGGKLVALLGRELYVVPVPVLDAAKFEKPLRVPAQQTITVVGDKDATIPLPQVEGGKVTLDYAVRATLPGVTVDGKAGTLRIDRAALLDHAGKVAYQTLSQTLYRDGRSLTPDERLADYQRETAVGFERLTGQKPTGLPVWVSVGLTGRDASLQAVEVDLGLFIEVPVDEVKKKFTPVRPPMPVQPIQPAPDDPVRVLTDMAGKLSRVEQRVGELQATIEKLNKLLDKKPEEKPK